MENRKEAFGADVERSYAGVLEKVSIGGLAASIIAYLLYVLHLMPLSVSVHDIAANWHLSSDELVAKGLASYGWAWAKHLPDADMLSLAAIGLLTLTPVACLAIASLAFLKKRDYAYTVISILQILVLLVAVSGVFIAQH
ncbi:DUF1634 domain-containing protein [Prosthecochloris sp. ZM]|uniref:DUF1634 domain-containing protein n=1 Tax=Prosthecochloris sp. ZM TaxID=2283143 RepID=UPI000DF7FE4E|nr:DUF1634 domain-containing protein [Prosthecochloris sp. ZM]RDD31203.1 DUF1634 domain-containing protein [Prosthecochloris sp. ZM]